MNNSKKVYDFDYEKKCEKDFVSIVMKHPDMLDMTYVKPEMLQDKGLRKVYDLLRKNGCYDPVIFEQSFDSDYLDDIYSAFKASDDSSVSSALRSASENITSFYKSYAHSLNNKRLNSGAISDSEFQKEFKRIEKIQPYVLKEHPKKDEIVSAVGQMSQLSDHIKLGKFKELGLALNLMKSDTVVVAADSGFGKSTFMLNLFDQFLDNDDCYAMYYNLEMDESEVLGRLLGISTEKDINNDIADYCFRRNNNSLKESNPVIEDAIDRLSDKDYHLSSGVMSWEQIKADILANRKTGKLNVVFLDYLGIINLESRGSMNRKQRISEIMRDIREMAINDGIMCFIACQINREGMKEYEKVRQLRGNASLSMHYLADAAEIERYATQVLLLSSDEVLEKLKRMEDADKYLNVFTHLQYIELQIAKSRHAGKDFRIHLTLNPANQYFGELSTGSYKDKIIKAQNYGYVKTK